jgi:hypothetical protein
VELKVDDDALMDLPIGAILWLSIKVEMFSLKETGFAIASEGETVRLMLRNESANSTYCVQITKLNDDNKE